MRLPARQYALLRKLTYPRRFKQAVTLRLCLFSTHHIQVPSSSSFTVGPVGFPTVGTVAYRLIEHPALGLTCPCQARYAHTWRVVLLAEKGRTMGEK
jgi:hypothetical protein